MALTSCRVRMNRTVPNGDAIYWEWAVDGATHDEVDGLALVNSTLQGLENGVGITGSPQFTDMDADLIELFPGGGGPAYYVQGLASELPVGTGAAAQQIVQCAVNELVETPRGAKALGRMFVGPAAGTTSSLLSSVYRDACIAVMQEMAAQHIADGYTPVVISKYLDKVERPSPVGFPVIGFRADLRQDVLVSRRVPDPAGMVDFPLEPDP